MAQDINQCQTKLMLISSGSSSDLVDTPKSWYYEHRGMWRFVMGIGADKRYFERDFKYEAIWLTDEGKRSVRDITKDLDIHPNVLHQWRLNYRVDMDQAFPGKGHLKAPEEELLIIY